VNIWSIKDVSPLFVTRYYFFYLKKKNLKIVITGM